MQSYWNRPNSLMPMATRSDCHPNSSLGIELNLKSWKALTVTPVLSWAIELILICIVLRLSPYFQPCVALGCHPISWLGFWERWFVTPILGLSLAWLKEKKLSPHFHRPGGWVVTPCLYQYFNIFFVTLFLGSSCHPTSVGPSVFSLLLSHQF